MAKYSSEQKSNAVELAAKIGAYQASVELGIAYNTLRSWVKKSQTTEENTSFAEQMQMENFITEEPATEPTEEPAEPTPEVENPVTESDSEPVEESIEPEAIELESQEETVEEPVAETPEEESFHEEIVEEPVVETPEEESFHEETVEECTEQIFEMEPPVEPESEENESDTVEPVAESVEEKPQEETEPAVEESEETESETEEQITDETEDFYDELCTDENIERYFFIDYENVNRDGLTGILTLGKNDCVRIYYSDKCKTLSFGLHRRIMATSARIEYTKVLFQIKNAADCQILFEIRESFKTHPDTEYYIVSKDSDFDKPIEICRNAGIHVSKILQISDAWNVEEETEEGVAEDATTPTPAAPRKGKTMSPKEMQIRTLFGQRFKTSPFTEHKEEIISLLMDVPDKQTLNTALSKILPGDKIKQIFNEYRAVIAKLPQRKARGKEEIYREEFEKNFPEKEFRAKEDEIIDILLHTPTRREINILLMKFYTSEKVGKILRVFRPLMKETPFK